MPEFTEEHCETLEKLEVDMYFGKDKDNPPMTIRMDRVERLIEQIVGIVSRLSWAIVVMLLSVIGDIVVRIAGVHIKP